MPRILIFLLTFAICPWAGAITIQLDYSHDTSNFFGINIAARNALEAAASDLSSAILPTLGAVNTDIFSGSNASATANLNWSLSYSNPETGALVTLNTFTFAADTITIYAGTQHLSGSTLGEGGPGGAGFSLGGGYTNEADFPGALTNAETSSNAVMARGGGPVIGNLSGTVMAGSTPASYDLDYGMMVGSIAFDTDTNNNGITDDGLTLDNFWHFNHTTNVTSGKNDFYSVALHELIHALGIGGSQTWDSLAIGTNWAGANAIALNGGSGANLISLVGGPDDGHLANGFASTTLFGGIAQEVVMDPTITTGTRKYLTAMDAAFLKDLGYNVVPEPGTVSLLLAGVFACGARRRVARLSV